VSGGGPVTIVLSRPDRLGDGVISTSAIRPIVEQTPAARVVFVARPALLPILRGHPLLHDCLSADEPLDVLTAKLRALEPFAIVHLHPHHNLYQAGRDAGIPVRVGYFQWRPRHALTHCQADRRRRGGKHEAMFNFDLLQRIGIAPPVRPVPEVHLPDSSLASLERTLGHPIAALKPYVVLNPSAWLRAARWPVAHFLRLADMIRRATPWKLVIIGADASDESTRELARALGETAVDLSGRTDVAELGWLLRHAAGVVTRDTGPSHLAGAVGAPTVSICGRTRAIYHPTRWGALGPRVELVVKCPPGRFLEKHRDHWRRSFAAITPEEVFQALLRVSRPPEPGH
jgi:ADP-heptose:LPS heptosyltransferase